MWGILNRTDIQIILNGIDNTEMGLNLTLTLFLCFSSGDPENNSHEDNYSICVLTEQDHIFH